MGIELRDWVRWLRFNRAASAVAPIAAKGKAAATIGTKVKPGPPSMKIHSAVA
jgi:hypothetical protein